QLIVVDAVGDALLLVCIALHVRLQALRRGGVWIAGRGVVLVVVDVAADLVLLAVDASFFLRRERAAFLQVVRLLTIDVLFLPFELAGFARTELARLQALLDAVLLVRVALRLDRGTLLLGLRRAGKCQRQRQYD